MPFDSLKDNEVILWYIISRKYRRKVSKRFYEVPLLREAIQSLFRCLAYSGEDTLDSMQNWVCFKPLNYYVPEGHSVSTSCSRVGPPQQSRVD